VELNTAIPIGVSIVNLGLLSKVASDLLGYSITKSIDNSGIPFSDHAKSVIYLSQFLTKSTKPLEDISNATSVLNHLHFSFIIYTTLSVALEISTSTHLEILSSKTKVKNTRLLYVSGVLNDWKHFIYTSSNRDLASSCLTSFSMIGLKEIFKDQPKLLK
jgi:hypothetical protein